jgi:glyoxylase-like metal-dependent hydrolase (beta-lactamase superfamily II)
MQNGGEKIIMIKDFKLLKAGHCKQLERVSIASGKWRHIEFPSLFSLITHTTKGNILFDTGYSSHFFDASKKFPYLIYPLVTPVTLKKEDIAVNQINRFNVSAESVKIIFISHFHADHIAGIKDFPQATFICSKEEYKFMIQKSGFAAVTNAFLPALMPSDFASRARFIEDCKVINISSELTPFKSGYDLFSDQSLIAVSLPGHTISQYGLFLKAPEAEYFLVGDACWSCEAYEKNIPPAKLASFIFYKWQTYLKTLEMLHQLSLKKPELRIVSSHCQSAFHKWGCKHE